MDMTSNGKSASVLELMASRICHDIISPVGAVNNGVEFMREMGPDSADEALELISYSASQAAAKLQAFRMAYGAGGRDPNIKPEDVQRAFSSLISAEGKIRQVWDPFGPLGPTLLPHAYCKMLMCSLMLAMECLPKGGEISVEAGEGSQSIIIAKGEDAGVREQVEEALAQDVSIDSLDPRLVHPYAIGVLCDHYGYKLSIKEKEAGSVTFALDCPQS